MLSAFLILAKSAPGQELIPATGGISNRKYRKTNKKKREIRPFFFVKRDADTTERYR